MSNTTNNIVDRNDDTTNMNQSNVDDDDDDNNNEDDDNHNNNDHHHQQQQRHMNDTTMPPPPSRQQQQQQQVSSLLTKSRQQGRSSNGGTNIISKSAAEIALGGSRSNRGLSKQQQQRTGFGLNDWTHLLSVTKDIVQLKGQSIRIKIQWNEIQTHNTIHDGWIVLYNSVYNITPYIPYHPGGSNILKSVLGNDATTLFNKYHRWVNIDGLIGKLLIGHLDPSSNRRSNNKNNNNNDDDTTDSD